MSDLARIALEIPVLGDYAESDTEQLLIRAGSEPYQIHALDIPDGYTIAKVDGKFVAIPISRISSSCNNDHKDQINIINRLGSREVFSYSAYPSKYLKLFVEIKATCNNHFYASFEISVFPVKSNVDGLLTADDINFTRMNFLGDETYFPIDTEVNKNSYSFILENPLDFEVEVTVHIDD